MNIQTQFELVNSALKPKAKVSLGSLLTASRLDRRDEPMTAMTTGTLDGQEHPIMLLYVHIKVAPIVRQITASGNLNARYKVGNMQDDGSGYKILPIAIQNPQEAFSKVIQEVNDSHMHVYFDDFRTRLQSFNSIYINKLKLAVVEKVRESLMRMKGNRPIQRETVVRIIKEKPRIIKKHIENMLHIIEAVDDIFITSNRKRRNEHIAATTISRAFMKSGGTKAYSTSMVRPLLAVNYFKLAAKIRDSVISILNILYDTMNHSSAAIFETYTCTHILPANVISRMQKQMGMSSQINQQTTSLSMISISQTVKNHKSNSANSVNNTSIVQLIPMTGKYSWVNDIGAAPMILVSTKGILPNIPGPRPKTEELYNLLDKIQFTQDHFDRFRDCFIEKDHYSIFSQYRINVYDRYARNSQNPTSRSLRNELRVIKVYMCMVLLFSFIKKNKIGNHVPETGETTTLIELYVAITKFFAEMHDATHLNVFEYGLMSVQVNTKSDADFVAVIPYIPCNKDKPPDTCVDTYINSNMTPLRSIFGDDWLSENHTKTRTINRLYFLSNTSRQPLIHPKLPRGIIAVDKIANKIQKANGSNLVLLQNTTGDYIVGDRSVVTNTIQKYIRSGQEINFKVNKHGTTVSAPVGSVRMIYGMVKKVAMSHHSRMAFSVYLHIKSNDLIRKEQQRYVFTNSVSFVLYLGRTELELTKYLSDPVSQYCRDIGLIISDTTNVSLVNNAVRSFFKHVDTVRKYLNGKFFERVAWDHRDTIMTTVQELARTMHRERPQDTHIDTVVMHKRLDSFIRRRLNPNTNSTMTYIEDAKNLDLIEKYMSEEQLQEENVIKYIEEGLDNEIKQQLLRGSPQTEHADAKRILKESNGNPLFIPIWRTESMLAGNLARRGTGVVRKYSAKVMLRVINEPYQIRKLSNNYIKSSHMNAAHFVV